MNVVYILATQYDNLGDLIINKELIKALSKQGSLSIDISKVPIQFRDELFRAFGTDIQQLEVSIRQPLFYWQLLTKKIPCDVVVFPPGAQPIGVNKRNCLSWFLQIVSIVVLKVFGIKVCCFGVSFSEDKRNWLSLLKWRLFNHIGIRSKELVELLQPKLNNVSYCPDLALLMKRSTLTCQVKGWGEYVVVSVRENIPEFIGESYSEALKESVNTILNSLENIDTIVILAQVERDCRFMLELKEHLSVNGKKIVVIPKVLTENEVCPLYRDAELVISNRLHVLLLAIINGSGIATLIHSQHFKLKNVLMDLELADTFIDIASIKVEISERTMKLVSNSTEVIKLFNKNKGIAEVLIEQNIKKAIS